MDWRFDTGAPIYSQLVSRIKFGIVSGELPSGERLTSVRDMAAQAGVNPNTMQRALTELEREGLVFSQRTSGRFVTEDKSVIQNAKKALAEAQVRAFIDSMSRLGFMRSEIVDMLDQRIKEEEENADI